MKTYTYEGKEYVESGEVREPLYGEHFVTCPNGDAGRQGYGHAAGYFESEGRRKILIPKEQKVSEVQDEYQIPVLVKADADGPTWNDKMNPYRGQVVMCRRRGSGYAGPKWGLEGAMPPAPSNQREGWHFLDSHVIPYPTQAQVEEERAKLAPKPDTLPAPVRAALQAADLGCRREGVEKLIEAIYSNPPRVSP